MSLTNREKAQVAGGAAGAGALGTVAWKKTKRPAEVLMGMHNATSGLPNVSGRPQKAIIRGSAAGAAGALGAGLGKEVVESGQNIQDVYRQQSKRRRAGKDTRAADILIGSTLGGAAAGGAIGAGVNARRYRGQPTKARLTAGGRGAILGTSAGLSAGMIGGLAGAHSHHRKKIAKAYVGGGKFMPASALGKEKLKANTRAGMYKPGRNRKNERIAATIRRGRADIDAWSNGARTTKEGGVTRISAYRPEEIAQAAAWRKGGKDGEKVLLVNRAEPIIGMRRSQVTAHEMAHLKPRRSEWRMGQIQASAVKSGREEGRADMAGGMHHRKYSKDMRRNAAGSMGAGFRIINQHRPSAYASAAAHEGTRKATDAQFRGLAAMNASEIQPGLFGRKAMQGYRQVQQNITRSQGDARARKSKRTGVAKAYDRKQLRDERGRWKGRKGPAGWKNRFYNPNMIVQQDKDRVKVGRPKSRKAIEADLKTSQIMGAGLMGVGGGVLGGAIGRAEKKMEEAYNPRPKSAGGLGGRTILDESGKPIQAKRSLNARLGGVRTLPARAALVGTAAGAGLGLASAPLYTDRHWWKDYPRDDDKRARRWGPRTTTFTNWNMAPDYDVVLTTRTPKQAREAMSRKKAALEGAKGSTDPIGALVGAGVGAASARPERVTAHLVRKEPVSKAIVKPLRPPAVGKTPKTMLTPKLPKMPGIKPVKPKRPPGVKLPQLPRPPRPGY